MLVGTLVAAGIEFVLVPYFGDPSDTVGHTPIHMLGAAIPDRSRSDIADDRTDATR